MVQTLGIGFTLGIGYYLVETGVRLPMTFATVEAATRHADMLKLAPLSTAEIRQIVREHEALR